ncbi:Bax inhibitor-1/YccA family membrane protein [Streptacidiphilus carbonis]|uniref:Bax inhibitor-1/YccA family membrane protein n=1 Tax=Streptacidiphilus carbonis TaxID=105422 RepID=UPI003F72961F
MPARDSRESSSASFSQAASAQVSAGVFTQTVLGGMAASAGVLVAYRLRLIRMTRRFTGYLGAAALGTVFLAGSDELLTALTTFDGLGFRSGGAGALCGLLGILLSVPCLSLHVRQLEEGIAHGAPGRESWAAASGLTLTLVWAYVEIFRTFTLVEDVDVFYL